MPYVKYLKKIFFLLGVFLTSCQAAYVSCIKKWTVGGSQTTKLLQAFINQTLLRVIGK